MKRVIIYIITVLFSICAGATLMYAADVYLIKEKNSDTIWFFGTVYEPLKWTNESFGCLYEEN